MPASGSARAFWAPLGIALLGGLAWGACFGRAAVVLPPWVSLVPLLLLAAGPRPGLHGWFFGFVSWLAALPWIVGTLTTYGQIDGWLAALLLAALAGCLALFTAAFALLAGRLWRGAAPISIWLGLPALWVALEWLRGLGSFGFPWNLAAYAVTETPGVMPLASWFGAWGVSFLVVFANVSVALSVVRRRVGWAVAGLATTAAVLLLARFAATLPATPEEARRVAKPVRILQPNTQNLTSWDALAVERNYRRLIDMSRLACDEPGALLVWPESAAWPFSFDADSRLRQDVEQLVALGCPVLFNSPRADGQRIFNSAYLVGGEGPGSTGHADKEHLVPFGEYVPLPAWFPFLRRIARSVGDFSPAEESRLLIWGDERLGAAICFEVIFPAQVARRVAAGATLLVTVTNDAWYGDTAAPWQHFRAARFRAAEHGRPLLRAAITGVSALIHADGSLGPLLGPGEEGVIRGEVRGRNGRTLFSRFPAAVPLLALVMAALAILRGR